MDREAAVDGAEEVEVLGREGRCVASGDEREGLEEGGLAAAGIAEHEHMRGVGGAGADGTVVVAVFGGEQMGLGGVVAVSAAGGVPYELGLKGGEAQLAGLPLVGVEVGGGEAGSELASCPRTRRRRRA